ncbi:cell wall hydrolase [Caulobacter henricii]|uniref:cell wall hydrolase n=1 Tax=Caulobacter henricii TaxID=69395 RepID=UPI000B1CA214|nr:cell wall hydrolase [Caulobacter henricii]
MLTAVSKSWIKAALGLLLLGGLSACATYYVPRGYGREAGVARVTRGFSDAALTRYVANMDPAMLSLARRHDPRPHTRYWGRVPGWERIDLASIPRFSDAAPDFDTARLINSLRRPAPLAIEPAKPFVLKASVEDRTKALRCLAQAVYFESAFEPLAGQEAVAQTVLNRMRHPGYPKTVCGVIYEGAARATGCQFSFTCDGSLAREPNPQLWASAESVARRALNGFVMKDVGVATHYHASYVAPYWAPTLVKLRQVGQHIFYRWTGPSGTLAAFKGKYRGGEDVTADILLAGDARTLEAAPAEALAAGAVVNTQVLAQAQAAGLIPSTLAPGAHLVAVPDATAPGGERLKFEGTVAGRRIPTPEEIAEINRALDKLPEVAAEKPPVAETPKAPPPKPKQRPPNLLSPLN